MSAHGFLDGMTDRELADLQTAILKEQAVRRKLDISPEKVEHAIAEYQKATGRGEGEPWVQPVTALDAYRRGAVVEHTGLLWISTYAYNNSEPGEGGWRELATQDEDGNVIYPPYRAPISSADAYELGEKITWTDGLVYKAARDGVAHSPEEYPPDWILVEPEDDEPEDDEPTDPDEPEEEEPTDPDEPEEEEPEGTLANPYTWSGDSVDYAEGEYVSYNETIYRLRSDHRSQDDWTPDIVPAIYEKV